MHLLLWAASNPDLLSKSARALIDTPDNSLLFSAVGMWEVEIKRSLGRHDFRLEPRLLRRGLLEQWLFGVADYEGTHRRHRRAPADSQRSVRSHPGRAGNR